MNSRLDPNLKDENGATKEENRKHFEDRFKEMHSTRFYVEHLKKIQVIS